MSLISIFKSTMLIASGAEASESKGLGASAFLQVGRVGAAIADLSADTPEPDDYNTNIPALTFQCQKGQDSSGTDCVEITCPGESFHAWLNAMVGSHQSRQNFIDSVLDAARSGLQSETIKIVFPPIDDGVRGSQSTPFAARVYHLEDLVGNKTNEEHLDQFKKTAAEQQREGLLESDDSHVVVLDTKSDPNRPGSGDHLVVPVIAKSEMAELSAHIKNFVHLYPFLADPALSIHQHDLFKRVAAECLARLNSSPPKPVHLQTHGAGQHWLHIRTGTPRDDQGEIKNYLWGGRFFSEGNFDNTLNGPIEWGCDCD